MQLLLELQGLCQRHDSRINALVLHAFGKLLWGVIGNFRIPVNDLN